MYQAPRGTQDVLPEDQPYWAAIYEQIRVLTPLYGYAKLDTPLFEDTGLFIRGVGEGTDIVDKEMYTFQDKGGDSLTLRPEFTAGVMRAYIEHGMQTRPQPVKLYSTGSIFRYERPQAGRYRQATQFNVEAIGEEDPALDVEVMSVAYRFYERLGFQGLSFQLNSIGCPQCRPTFLQALRSYYEGRLGEACADCQRRLGRNPMRLLDCKERSCQPLIDAAPRISDYLCPDCAQHFARVREYLDRLGMRYTLNHRLVRGLDYYTRTVFEVWAQGIGAQNALCGGGRYDGLAEALGGAHIPGVGFAAGIERAILLMKEQGTAVPPVPQPLVLVATQGAAAKALGVSLTAAWRDLDIGVQLSFGERSFKSQMRQANRAAVRYVVMIGDEEMAQGRATVRDMTTSEQWSVPQSETVEDIRARLQRI
jgi:histidyl-tRNA synthetase